MYYIDSNYKIYYTRKMKGIPIHKIYLRINNKWEKLGQITELNLSEKVRNGYFTVISRRQANTIIQGVEYV